MTQCGSPPHRRATALLGGFALTAAIAGCGGADGAGGAVDEVRVGLLFPTSGPMADLGTDQLTAARLMLERANDNGGVGGASIEIVEGDSQSDPGTGATVAQRMVDQDDVDVIIGSYASGIAQAIVPVAQRNEVILWEVGAVAPDVNESGSPNFLRTVGASATYASADLDFIEDFVAPELDEDPGDVRIAVAYEDGPFGSSVGEEIVAQADDRGMDIVAEEPYPEDSSDMTPVVLRLEEAEPDILLIVPLPASTPLFWQAARTQDFNVDAVVGSAGFSSTSFLERFDAEGIEGVYDVEAPAVDYMGTDNLDDEARAALEDVSAGFAEDLGRECLVHCGDGLGGTFVLVEDVLPRAVESGSVDAEAIREAAEETDLADGGTPQGFGAKFDENGDNERAKSSIMQWQDGDLRVVYPEEIADAEPVFPMPTWDERE